MNAATITAYLQQVGVPEPAATRAGRDLTELAANSWYFRSWWLDPVTRCLGESPGVTTATPDVVLDKLAAHLGVSLSDTYTPRCRDCRTMLRRVDVEHGRCRGRACRSTLPAIPAGATPAVAPPSDAPTYEDYLKQDRSTRECRSAQHSHRTGDAPPAQRNGSGYTEFLHQRAQLNGNHGFEPAWMPDFLYGFQAMLVEWALLKGRGGIFADCGLGKTPMQLVWAANVYQHTGRPVLIATPLAVASQTESEAAKFGIDAGVSRDGKPSAAITITNYDRLHLFNREDYGGVVCDESSAIKSFDGERRKLVTEFMRKTPYRLLCTATAAPNDYIELGTSSEALGYLGYMDMLGRFFTNKMKTSAAYHGKYRVKDRDVWRFKGHAEEPFWRWVASWARALRRPSDYGYPDDGFQLPDLIYRQHEVTSNADLADGALFTVPAVGLKEERAEARRTLNERCAKAAELLADADHAVAWCHLNTEGDRLTREIGGAVQVKGSDSVEAKEETLTAFTRGDIRVLVTKPSIAGWGLNWQHAHQMTYFPSHSYEQHYQAVRRCWRFGQQHPVTVDIITTEGGRRSLANLERKAEQANRMFDALVGHMRTAAGVDRTITYPNPVEVPRWASQNKP